MILSKIKNTPLYINRGDFFMRLKRLLRNYWFVFLGSFIIIILLLIPNSHSYKKNIVYNTNHEYRSKICVNVSGEVNVRGKMYFYEGDTLRDLLNASGVTDYTNKNDLNLDDLLKDGFTYNISYTKNKNIEISNHSTMPNEIINVKKIKNDEAGLININEASLEVLKTLSGIGTIKANSIVSYRKIKKFESIDDIKNVEGITDDIFNKIKDFITC